MTGKAEAGFDVEGVVGVTLLSGGERDARGAEESPVPLTGDLRKAGECEGGGVSSSSSRSLAESPSPSRSGSKFDDFA